MNPLRSLRSLAILAACLVTASALADPLGFLFDVLQKGPYRVAWDKLMKDVQPTPDWLVQFNRNFDGDSSAFVPVTVGGKPYALSFVCKPADCGSRKFVVLFDAGGLHAFGALGGRDEPPAFFGGPTQDEQDALSAPFKG